MGMAASQARLLSITARLADNELRSQTINNAKMRLATQSSQASENYINALNEANYQFTNYDLTGGVVSQPLTFNALTAYSPYNTQYGLINSAGEILVSENEAKIYKDSGGNLDAFLKGHGLVYDTTYFETLAGTTDPNAIATTNAAYPAPFKEISVKDLKKYFEAYNSYETSIEVDKFNNSYDNFIIADKNIHTFGAQIFAQYLLDNNKNNNDITKTTDGYTLGFSGNVNTMKTQLSSAFSGSNQYNLNSLYNKGYISENTRDLCQSYIDNLVPSGNNLIIQENLDVITEKDDYGNITGYTIDGIKVSVDSFGKVINCTSEDNTATIILATGYSATDGTRTFDEIIQHLTYQYQTTNEGTTTIDASYTYHKNADGKYYRESTISDANIIKEKFEETVTTIINTLKEDAIYTKFCEDLLNGTTGMNLDSITIEGYDGSAKDLVETYVELSEDFLKFVFGDDDYDDVRNQIKAGDVYVPILDKYGNDTEETMHLTMENLQDIDFILQYLRYKTGEISCTEDFNTVIKEFIIDNMIAEYGTPKYAWIDENDKSTNQENADAKAQWYTNLFHRMQKGYKALENGLASSKEWIEYALENGTVYMEQVDKSFAWNALDFKTCSRITEETNDKAIAKAEAEYNRAMNDIKTKDNIYDLELKNIDTEHNALQTEYDVIKGVINKNIERNFKFNQSA